MAKKRQIKKYELNSARCKINVSDEWQYYQINTEAVWSKNLYKKIIEFRRKADSDDYLLETEGSMIAIIPLKKVIIQEIKNYIITSLERILKVEIELVQVIEKNDIFYKLIRNCVGRVIQLELEKLGFEKIGSGGGVGRYYHYEISETEKLSQQLSLERVFDFSLELVNNMPDKIYLSVDSKTVQSGIERLSKLLKERKLVLEKFDHWSAADRNWKLDREFFRNNWNTSITDRSSYIIKKIIPWKDNKQNSLNLPNIGKLRTLSLKEVVQDSKTALIPKFIIVLQNKSMSSKNRNKNYYVIAEMLSRKITHSSIRDSKFERAYHKFSKPSMIKRKRDVFKVFEFLRKAGIVGPVFRFDGEKPKLALPSVKTNKETIYGKVPDITVYGVEDWGNLNQVVICYNSDKDKHYIQQFQEILQTQILRVAKKSGLTNISVKMKKVERNEVKKLAQTQVMNKVSKIYIFIMKSGRDNYSYKQIKTWFTQENGKPVQAVKLSSLLPRNGRNPNEIREIMNRIVKTLIPQILAKTGGLPYSMSPKILDETLIIGLDKGRDSSSVRPSASAGVAAVTTDGRYVAGASTPLETTKDDSIDVDILAPPLLEQLKGKYKDKLKYLVLLRDGAPAICQDEVPKWSEYIKEYKLGFVFFASRKMNKYRVFSSGNAKKLKLPVILFGEPLQKDEFLVISANSVQGTPKPVLYTMMENTTEYTPEDVITKVIPQVISMSMLSWESPMPTSQPLPLHYADKLAAFAQLVQQAWNSSIEYPMFI